MDYNFIHLVRLQQLLETTSCSIGSLRLNRGKIGRLIQAVCKVTSAPAHFWDRNARWFVVRLYRLGQLVTSSSVFS